MAEERLHKVLAARGVASRRAAETMIQEGRVSVDGRVVLELGAKVDAAQATIKVDGRTLQRPRPLYLLLNKPRGYLTTASDPEGRRTIYDLLDVRERVFPVGRLDMDSEGLLLLTNDGELANRIAHPRYRIDKEYHALVAGLPPPGALDYLRRGGLLVAGGRTSPADIVVLGQEAGGAWLRVIIHEGRKRQVRRMLEEIGHPVRRLRRVRLGPLTLAGVAAAAYRPLTPVEVNRLRRLVGLTGDEDRGERTEPTTARRVTTMTALGVGRPHSKMGQPSGEAARSRPRPARSTGRPTGGPPRKEQHGQQSGSPRGGGRGKQRGPATNGGGR